MAESKYQNFLVYDVETGGLPSKENPAFDKMALTEVALVMVSPELEIIAKTSFLFAPYFDDLIYTSGAASVSGITKQMCIDEGIDPFEALDITQDFISTYNKSKKKPTLVGHNIIKFDNPFLENWFKACNDDLYKYVNKDPKDTLDLCHLLFPEAPNYKLGTMCDQFGVELVGAHRALPDTIANAELFIEIMKNLRGENVPEASTEGVTVDLNEKSIIDKVNEFQF